MVRKRITGTWSGTLSGNGEALPATCKFASTGNPIYEYQTKNGECEVELTAPGQTIRFVPPEGGVVEVSVESLSVLPARVGYALSVSQSRASGETLDQSVMNVLVDCSLAGADLETTMTITVEAAVSQPGIVIPSESQATYQGVLKQEGNAKAT